MDRLIFVFSLLLIVSVTTTFGSMIKAKLPTKEVKKVELGYCLWSKILLVVFHGICYPFSYFFYLELAFHAETGFA